MTIIAWDGETLAADRLSTSGGYKASNTKIYRVPGGLLGFSGSMPHAMALLNWFCAGRDPEKWPVSRVSGCYADCLFVSLSGEVLEYYGEHGPYPTRCEDKFAAMGSGRDYALAAMHLGKTAVEAVQVASALDTGCGNGIDILEL